MLPGVYDLYISKYYSLRRVLGLWDGAVIKKAL